MNVDPLTAALTEAARREGEALLRRLVPIDEVVRRIDADERNR